jgi:hypothetical protein
MLEHIRELIQTPWAWALPFVIALVLLLFLRSGKRLTLRELERLSEQQALKSRMLRDLGSQDKPPALTQVLQRPDATLRVLEEVYEPRGYAIRREWNSPDAKRLHALDAIQSEIKKQLRESVQADGFPETRDRLIKLLDEISVEQGRLQNKEPFNEIQEPEKSLLIDVFAEIDPTHTVARQKAFQLANIIKLKHQDMLKLQAANAKAATWTKWGTAGTVLFGVLSIVLSVVTIKLKPQLPRAA